MTTLTETPDKHGEIILPSLPCTSKNNDNLQSFSLATTNTDIKTHKKQKTIKKQEKEIAGSTNRVNKKPSTPPPLKIT